MSIGNETTDEAGAYGTRRGAGRLARFPPGWGMPPIRPLRNWDRVTVAPWPTPYRDTLRLPRIGGIKNRPPPVRGRAVSGPWYHPTSWPLGAATFARTAPERDAAAR